MSYVLLHADLTALDDAEIDDFAAAAADLDLDVIDLAPDLADTEVIVVISSSLGALVTKVAEIAGDKAGARLWDLIQRLWRRDMGARAIEDRDRRITIVLDDPVRHSGPVAIAGLITVLNAIDAIQDGITLRWNEETGRWSADQANWLDPAMTAP